MCAACRDIDAGRFVDLLELDAASNTGIDNMREILDNARYAPTVGRYKVYLIDEVHMLSKAAFNSMLKTLEEPPEHVKFVLATTDPQKIPVDRAVALPAVQPEAAAAGADRGAARTHPRRGERSRSTRRALALIARAAHGSMRDALSLLDQAIAYGGGERAGGRRAADARRGRPRLRVPHRRCARSPRRRGAARRGDALRERGLSFGAGARGARVAVPRMARRAGRSRRAPTAIDDARRASPATPARFTPEAVQLAYQICAQGRADLALAPDEATGFAMTLLRHAGVRAGRRPGGDAGEPARRRVERAGRARPRARRRGSAAAAARASALAGRDARRRAATPAPPAPRRRRRRATVPLPTDRGRRGRRSSRRLQADRHGARSSRRKPS